MISLLQEYLAIDTSYPRPDYAAVIALFKKYAVADGFLVTDITLPSGNPVLVITLPGNNSNLQTIALNHHMDVVPADNEHEWKFDPFEGTIYKNRIYGRGTQDCKALGVVHYETLKRLGQSGKKPERSIHVIMVPDEERGGFQGTKEFIEHPLFKTLNIGYVLDEGMPSGCKDALLIKIDERTPIQIRITSNGPQSHASGLFNANCIHQLNSCLSRIIAFHAQQQTTSMQPGNVISLQITSVSSTNNAANVIPSQARAIVDIRIPSAISLDKGLAVLDQLVQQTETLSYEVLATSIERFRPVPINSEFYKAVAQSINDCGLQPTPFVFEATTDSRFYSAKGIQAIGFTPFSIKPNLHGTDECIYISDLEQGVSILFHFLQSFCF